MLNRNATSRRTVISAERMAELRAQKIRTMLAHAILVSTAILVVAAIVLVSIP